MKTEQLDAYLLRRLPEESQTEVEDRYFDDDELFTRLVEREDDLLDRWASGTLDEEDARRLRELAMSDPRLARRLEFARLLNRHFSTNSMPEVVSIASRRRRVAPRYLMAAAFMLVLAGAMWFTANRREARLDSAQVAKNEQTTATAPPVAAPAPVTTSPVEIAKSKPKEPSGEPSVRRNDVMTFALSLATVRSDGATPQLTKNAANIRFAVALDPAEEYERVEVEISGPDGARRFGPVTAPVTATADGRRFQFDVPSAQLGTGSHELTVRGLAGVEREEIGFVQFAVK